MADVNRKPTAAQARREAERAAAEQRARRVAELCRKNEQEHPTWVFDENGRRIGLNK